MAYKDVDVDIVVTPIVSYTDIANKPKLNGFELVGDVTLEDVGLGNVVQYVDYEYEGEQKRGIQLDNNVNIVGVTTTGDGANLVVLSKWDVADFGSPKVHMNLNTKDIVTVNDSEGVMTNKNLIGFLKAGSNISITQVEETYPGTEIPYQLTKFDVDAYTKAEADSKYAEKTTIPTKLPNPEALTIKYNGQTAFTYDGSQSETGNFIVNAETVPMSADEQAITVKQELDKKVNVSDLSTVATTGSYNDLTDKPQSSGLQLKWFSKLSGVTLDISPIETSSVYKIYKNGLLLEPNVGDEVNDYSLSGTTITFTSELLDTDKITVEHTV